MEEQFLNTIVEPSSLQGGSCNKKLESSDTKENTSDTNAAFFELPFRELTVWAVVCDK